MSVATVDGFVNEVLASTLEGFYNSSSPEERTSLLEFEPAVKEFTMERVFPMGRQMEKDEKVPDDLVREMARLGLFGLSIPVEYGGSGFGVTGASLVALYLAYGDMGASLVPIATESLAGGAIIAGGDEEQKKYFLRGIASGELFGSFGLTEDVGSSFSGHMKTSAIKRGDRWVINPNGSVSKKFITEADRADFCVVYAKDATKGSDTEGQIVAFIVPNAGKADNVLLGKSSSGYRVIGKENKMGLRNSATCELSVEDVEVPEEWLLGIKNGRPAAENAWRTLEYSRPTIAAQALGNAWAALNEALAWEQGTPRGGDAEIYLDSLPLYQVDVGELTERLAAETMKLFGTTKLMDRARREGREKKTRMYSSGLKISATRAGYEICLGALLSMGGYGYMKDYNVERRLRDGVAPMIYEGHNRVQLRALGKIIAEEARRARTA